MRPAPVIFLLVTVVLWIAWPGLTSAQVKLPLTVKVVYTTVYDDNILKYSARDLSRFGTNTESYPSEITTTDDWVNSLGLRLYRDFKLGSHYKFRPYYAGKISLYAVNSVKNYQSHTFLGRLTYRNRVHLTLNYFYLPGYYLRLYQDRDLNEYHATQFDLSRPALSLRGRYQDYEVEGEWGREYVYYNSYFTEYDSEAWFWGLTGTYSGRPNLDVSLGYAFKQSDNIGFNQTGSLNPVNPGVDTEYGDASYEEDQYSLNLSYQLPLKSHWDWSFSLALQRSWRYYQSSQSLLQDPFHAGRRDRRDTFEPVLSVTPFREFTAEFHFTYDLRRSFSPDPNVSSVKNFDVRTFEMALIYQIF